jgi:holin-like protein
MLGALATLLVFQTIGEVLSWLLRLPVPGPVIGMALLLGWLRFRPAAYAELRETGVGLLKHLSLLFVPAGVGVMLHASRLADEWLPIGAALLLSTALAIVVTALVIEASRRWLTGDRETQDRDGSRDRR